MSNRYNAADIEVLSGLDPVRRRPGMYTDTTRPNHLAQEVIDNAVDEALAGHARTIEVVLHADGSCEVSDDGRGMPVDVHPEEKVPGVELILTRLHAGGKFSNRNYTFSGGLHGVGVSVVNALSRQLEVFIRRDGNEYRMTFAGGDRASPLEIVGSVGKRNTGTRLRFWPDPKYFDTPKFNLRALRHLLRAKAVLAPGLTVRLHDVASEERHEWHYEDGLRDYLKGELAGVEVLPPELFVGQRTQETETADWAVAWVPDGELVQESYVNLIPTAQHGTHVNGLRTGFTDALRVELMSDEAPVAVTLIQPTAVNTPYPEHARNYMDKEPKLPSPQIDPKQVAEAILEAACKPERDVKVGAMSRLNTVAFKLTPKLADWLATKQATRQNYDAPAMNPLGTLYQPGETGRIHGQPPEARAQ